jgi:hypothetical protein
MPNQGAIGTSFKWKRKDPKKGLRVAVVSPLSSWKKYFLTSPI